MRTASRPPRVCPASAHLPRSAEDQRRLQGPEAQQRHKREGTRVSAPSRGRTPPTGPCWAGRGANGLPTNGLPTHHAAKRWGCLVGWGACLLQPALQSRVQRRKPEAGLPQALPPASGRPSAPRLGGLAKGAPPWAGTAGRTAGPSGEMRRGSAPSGDTTPRSPQGPLKGTLPGFRFPLLPFAGSPGEGGPPSPEVFQGGFTRLLRPLTPAGVGSLTLGFTAPNTSPTAPGVRGSRRHTEGRASPAHCA